MSLGNRKYSTNTKDQERKKKKTIGKKSLGLEGWEQRGNGYPIQNSEHVCSMVPSTNKVYCLSAIVFKDNNWI